MFKRVIAAGFALLLLALFIAPASAQTGYVAVYFDENLTIEQMNCPGAGIPQTLTIAMVNWNMFIMGVQFQVQYPPELIWLADFNLQPVTAGTTPTGFAQGWAIPQNGFGPIKVCNVLAQWNCTDCSSTNSPIKVQAHPLLGPVAATQWPDANLVNGIGLTALVCATVPTEETTWGQVKALYNE